MAQNLDNYLTEAQARKKWCPEVRLLTKEGTTSYNRRGDALEYPPRVFCIGSACAGGWRWKVPQIEGAEPVGYCGRAGKPE